MDYDYEEPYYEPTIADELLIEYQQKMKDALLESVKNDIENIKSENERLKEENKRLRENDYAVQRKQRELDNKIKTIERNFYKDKFTDILKDIVYEGYTINYKLVKQEKCNECDENRQITYTSTTGKSINANCECNKSKTVYYPAEIQLYQVKINKRNNWHDDKLWLTVRYHEKEWESKEIDLELKQVVEKFTEENKDKRYGVIYLSKEECQKHCDYLTNKAK